MFTKFFFLFTSVTFNSFQLTCYQGKYVDYNDFTSLAVTFNVPHVKLWVSEDGNTQIKDIRVSRNAHGP